jgi:hypothetical protein
MSFLLSLMFLFNKIGEESRTGFAWKGGVWEGQGRGGWWAWGRDGPNNVCTYE